MYKIDGTTIYLTRGDTLITKINIMQGDEEYVPQEGDTVRFALKNARMKSDRTDFLDTKPLVLKAVPMNTLLLRLEPADTKKLPFGSYIYDIQITMADGTVDTFISGKLILQAEVE